MKIIINSSSMVPIYEQIVDQVKAQIISGELKEDDNLPSVRTLSKELRISALTVKKAYDSLEQEGFTVTIHGKGTYVAAANKEMMMEEYRREVEEELTEVIRKAKRYGLPEEDIREIADCGQVLGDYANNPRVATIPEMYELLMSCYDRK